MCNGAYKKPPVILKRQAINLKTICEYTYSTGIIYEAFKKYLSHDPLPLKKLKGIKILKLT
jgi:hypothetical protein